MKFVVTGHVYNGLEVQDYMITTRDQALSIYPFDFY